MYKWKKDRLPKNLRYVLGAMVAFPLLPLMYVQGKRIRASVPRLPEAKGMEGKCLFEEKTDTYLNLLAIGESTMAGVGVETHKEGFTGILAAEICRLFQKNVRWKVYARSGYTAKKVDQKIIPTITEHQAHLLIIGLGGNDAFTLNRPSKWREDIRSLIRSLNAKFPEALIVFCQMPPIKEFPAFTPLIKFTVGNLVEILGEELEEIVKEFPRVIYFSDRITLKGWVNKYQLEAKKEDFFSDGVHPSQLTYQVWARDVANEMFKHAEIQAALPSHKGLSNN